MPKTALARTVVVLSLLLTLLASGYASWRYLQHRDGGTTSSSGAALIGGPFQLLDHEGMARSEKDLLGRYSFIYFGYTFCPDVCPTALWTMSQALDILAESAPQKVDRIVPVFFTVDPERDTVEVMADYVENFRTGFVGLTGTLEQTSAAAKAYRVFFRKADETDKETYLVDHSSIVYLMDPNGQYLTHFTHASKAETMAEEMAKLVEG